MRGRTWWLGTGLLVVMGLMWIGARPAAQGQAGPPPTVEELRAQQAALVKFLGNASTVDLYLDHESIRQRTPSLSRVYPQRLERLGNKVFVVLSVGGTTGVEGLMIDTAEILAIARQPIP
jgi:hypothetical protein